METSKKIAQYGCCSLIEQVGSKLEQATTKRKLKDVFQSLMIEGFDKVTMSEIILIRGVPDSGISTIAVSDYPNHVNCEADQFFRKMVVMLLSQIHSLNYGKCSTI